MKRILSFACSGDRASGGGTARFLRLSLPRLERDLEVRPGEVACADTRLGKSICDRLRGVGRDAQQASELLLVEIVSTLRLTKQACGARIVRRGRRLDRHDGLQ